PPRPAEAWEVTRVAGLPLVGTTPLGATGALKVGDWLQTDDSSRAVILVGDIGHVDVKPDTRIRLVRAQRTDHRLALERGEIYATVDAPPRLFFVDTPAGTVVDLGCAYTLAVDSSGDGTIHVSAGYVEFDWSGRRSIVPLGFRAETRRGFGPGTPYAEDASHALRRALAAFDFAHGGGGAEAVRQALAAARPEDAVSLWHLLRRVDRVLRGEVYDRLASLVPPPPGAAGRFVVEQAGRIRIIKDGQLLATPFLDLRDSVGAGGERGLLSMAFHPQFARNGWLYVNYTDKHGDTRVKRFTVSAAPDR